MGLTVITHTEGKRPELLAWCVASVESQLPAGATHKIIQTSHLASARIASLELDDTIVWVDDDDDVVINNSLQICWDQLLLHKCDLAFTNELRVNLQRDILSWTNHHDLTYESLTQVPTIAHQIAMFKPEKIRKAVAMQTRYNTGLCWFAKVEAGIRGGAVHVPMVGYEWTIHTASHSNQPAVAAPMRQHLQSIRRDLAQLIVTPNQLIPVADIPLDLTQPRLLTGKSNSK